MENRAARRFRPSTPSFSDQLVTRISGGALLALSLSIFIHWDRAKSARHELVDTYLYSSWPPVMAATSRNGPQR
jgi:hypothetical protein